MNAALKRIAVRTLAPLGTFRLARQLMPLSEDAIPILAYHRIVPLENDSSHQGDVELVSATPESFRWEMRYLARSFTPVTFTQIADAFDGKARLPRRPIAVTFDDAFEDLYDHAFPILKDEGVSATIFAATAYVENRQPMWFDQLAYVVMHMPPGSIALRSELPKLPTSNDFSARQRAAYLILRHLKDVEESERERFVGEVFERFFDIVQRSTELLGRALSWDQMREMSAVGIEFGSHTVSHRSLGQLSPEDVRWELAESKRQLEQNLQTSISSIAYPFGGRTAYTTQVQQLVREAGYRIGTSYLPGLNFLASSDRFGLVRQHVERYTSRADFEALVNFPQTFR